MHHLSRHTMSGGSRRMEAARSSDVDIQHQSARVFRSAPSRSLQHLPHRKPLMPVRSSTRRRTPSPRLPAMNREEKRFREHFGSKEKERQAGGYKREFWSSEFNMSAHSAPHIGQTERSSRRGFSPRSRGTFRSMPERQPMTDPRYDNYRRSDVVSGYRREMPGRIEVPIRREFDDSFYGRNGRFEEPEEAFHHRSLPRPAQHYEERDRGVSTHYRGRSLRRGRYEPRPDLLRSDFNRDRGDWADVRRPGLPKRTEEPDTRNQNMDAHDGERRRSFDRPNLRTTYKTLVSSDLRRNERSNDRIRKASISNSPQSPAEIGARLTSKLDLDIPRGSARSSSSTKREFDQELRPEEILVTRKYQNSMEHKESVSNVYPDEERRVKIIREPSSGKNSVSAGENVQTLRSSRKFELNHSTANSEVLSSGVAAEEPVIDAHGDTDDRIMNKSVGSQTGAVSLRSKLQDFGDKDDRPDRTKLADKEIFCFDGSDDVSQRRRSQSRDEEGPRERFDRRVNTRDPDDLRNSLARRRKMQRSQPSDKGPENGLQLSRKPSKEPSGDSLKRRSADASPSRSKDRRDSSPKRRRMSEGHNFRPAMPAFKRPFAVPRRDFGYHSAPTSLFRGRRYSAAVPASGRGMPRDLPGRRFARPISRGASFRRGAVRQ